MNIKESLDIFGLSNISEENEENLKKIYKKLMIKYHPDNYGGDDSKAKDISMAYKVIKETLKKIDTFEKIHGTTNKVKKSTVVFSIDNLIHLYKNKELLFRSKTNSNNKRIFTTSDLRNYGALLIIDWSVMINGSNNNFYNICHWNNNDKYQVSCEVIVDDLNAQCNMKIKLLDKEREYNIKSQSIQLKITLDYNIVVEILINKKLRPDKEEQA